MTYAFVHEAHKTGNNLTITPSTAGNLLFVTLRWGGSSGITTPTFNSGAFTPIGTAQNIAGYDTFFFFQSFYYQNNPGGITSIDITSWDNYTPSSIGTLNCVEYSGIATSSALITHAEQGQLTPGTGADAVTSGSTSVGTAPALIIGWTETPELGNTLNTGTGFTRRVTNDGGGIEDKRITSSGSTAATFTAATAPDATWAQMVAFAEPAASDTLFAQALT